MSALRVTVLQPAARLGLKGPGCRGTAAAGGTTAPSAANRTYLVERATGRPGRLPGARAAAGQHRTTPIRWRSPATTTRASPAAPRSWSGWVALRRVGIDVYQIDHEDANGQFEVNFTYADALNGGRQLHALKMATSEIANQMGMIATFMPKPFSNRTGTGGHFHISVGDEKTKNLFHDDKDKNGLGLSKMGYQFLGGLLHHAHALTAICAPTVNSYKRLVVGRALSGATWAPAYITYGDNNRTCMVRVPYGRLEMRLPDGSCNPYLASAAILAAGMDGVAKKIDPGPPNNDQLVRLDQRRAEEGWHRRAAAEPERGARRAGGRRADLQRDRQGSGRGVSALKRMEWVEYQRHVSVGSGALPGIVLGLKPCAE